LARAQLTSSKRIPGGNRWSISHRRMAAPMPPLESDTRTLWEIAQRY
jgi:hypothetical protein